LMRKKHILQRKAAPSLSKEKPGKAITHAMASKRRGNFLDMHPPKGIQTVKRSTDAKPFRPTGTKLSDKKRLNLKLGERCSNSSDCASRFCSTMKLTGECGLSGNTNDSCFCLPGAMVKDKAKGPLMVI